MTDLEQLIRETLHDRAETVTSGPSWTPADAAAPAGAEILDLIPPREPRPRRSWRGPAALLAAAAVVGGVVAAVVVTTRHGASHDRAAHSSLAHRLAPVDRAACRATLPPAWRAAARAASTPLPGVQNPMLWGTTADGTAVLQYSDLGDSQPHSITDRIGIVSPGSSALHELARITTRTRGLGLDVDVDQNLVVVSVDEGINRTERWTRILAIDTTTGLMTTIADVPASARGQLTGAAFALDGNVYWHTKTGKGADSERIHVENLATGARSIAARGVFDLERSAAGVSWSLTPWRMDRPASLPPAVAAHVNELSYDSFVTDGSSYAWVSSDGALEWWSAAVGHVVRVPHLLARPFSISEPGMVWAVAGPLVVYEPPHTGGERILDTRTGATVPISSEVTLRGHRGTLVGDPIGSDAIGDSLMRLDTSRLSELHC